MFNIFAYWCTMNNLDRKLQSKVDRFQVPIDPHREVTHTNLSLPTDLLMCYRNSAVSFEQNASVRYFHDKFVLFINLETSGTIVVDNSFYELFPGYAFLVFPFQFHHYATFKNERLSWIICTFDYGNADEFTDIKNIPIPITEFFKIILSRQIDIYLSSERCKPEDQNQIILLMRLLLNEMLCSASAQPNSIALFEKNADRDHILLFRQVGRYIKDNMDKPISLAEIAQHVAVSGSHLRHLFKQHLGISLGRYIRHIRLWHATTMLETTGLSLTEIAYKCGFNSIYAFSRAYKRENGKNPSAVRQQHNK